MTSSFDCIAPPRPSAPGRARARRLPFACDDAPMGSTAIAVRVQALARNRLPSASRTALHIAADDVQLPLLARPGPQPALVVALADGHAARAQDVVGGDCVEMEVGQRERGDEVLRHEGEPPRADLEIELLARAAVDLVAIERRQRRLAL